MGKMSPSEQRLFTTLAYNIFCFRNNSQLCYNTQEGLYIFLGQRRFFKNQEDTKHLCLCMDKIRGRSWNRSFFCHSQSSLHEAYCIYFVKVFSFQKQFSFKDQLHIYSILNFTSLRCSSLNQEIQNITSFKNEWITSHNITDNLSDCLRNDLTD